MPDQCNTARRGPVRVEIEATRGSLFFGGAGAAGDTTGREPGVADDFVFWYQDMYLNKELIPVPLTVMTINGKPITLEKVDATTVRLVAPEPYYALPIVLASVWGSGTTPASAATGWAASRPPTISSSSIPSTRSRDRWRRSSPS